MRLKIDGLEVGVKVEAAQDISSRHTGATLKQLEVSFRVPDEDSHEKIQDFLEQSDEVTSLAEAGSPEATWKITNNSFSYQQGRRGYNYSCDLLSIEELNIETLIVAGTEFKPYDYIEYFMGDHLAVTARVTLPKERFDELKKLLVSDAYFRVVRRGVNDEEREMRFGTNLLSRDGENFKVQFTLVDCTFDDEHEKFDRGEAQMSNIRATLARTTEMFDGLLSLLVNKGTITDEDRESIESVSADRILDSLLEFNMVDDLDQIPITA
jgi:hypothetical protein